MKKLLICFTLAAMLLAGCGKADPKPTSAATTVPTQPETEPTTAVTHLTEPTEVTTSKGLQLAPDFTVYTADGAQITLEHLRGKPVVLNFWASSCPPCRSEMPAFQMAFDRYGAEYHFVMVNLTDGAWDDLESATAFIQEQDYTFPVYFDTEQEAVAAYGINAIPATYFIDAEGGAVAWYSGAMDYETLMVGLELLAEELPGTETTSPVE